MTKITCNTCGDYIEAANVMDAIAWDNAHQIKHTKEA
jgi:hypothetical protein